MCGQIPTALEHNHPEWLEELGGPFCSNRVLGYQRVVLASVTETGGENSLHSAMNHRTAGAPGRVGELVAVQGVAAAARS